MQTITRFRTLGVPLWVRNVPQFNVCMGLWNAKRVLHSLPCKLVQPFVMLFILNSHFMGSGLWILQWLDGPLPLHWTSSGLKFYPKLPPLISFILQHILPKFYNDEKVSTHGPGLALTTEAPVKFYSEEPNFEMDERRRKDCLYGTRVHRIILLFTSVWL